MDFHVGCTFNWRFKWKAKCLFNIKNNGSFSALILPFFQMISATSLFVFLFFLQGQPRLTVDKRSQDGHIICPVIFLGGRKR